MKKILTVLFLCIIFNAQSQESKHVENIFSIKAGAIGAWISYEKAFDAKFTVNSEIGYEGGMLKGTDDKIDYVFTTILSVEPRYYYNLNKRQAKGKNTNKNSANYLGAELLYVPDIFSATNRNNVYINKALSIIPKYGLRRSITNKLIFEFAFGVGYSWIENSQNGLTATMDLRINFCL